MSEFRTQFLYVCCDVMRRKGGESLLSDDFMRQCNIATCQLETRLSGRILQRETGKTGSNNKNNGVEFLAFRGNRRR